MVQILKQEKLIKLDDSEPASSIENAFAEAGPAPESYEAPAVHKYTDMENLLLLDPIHEVEEEAGWPHAAAE